MTERQQFEVMANMLSELKDGHDGIYTPLSMLHAIVSGAKTIRRTFPTRSCANAWKPITW